MDPNTIFPSNGNCKAVEFMMLHESKDRKTSKFVMMFKTNPIRFIYFFMV